VNFDQLGGRRFLIAQQVLVVSTALVACGKITSGDWVTVTLGIAGVFVAGNVAQRQIEAKKEANGTP